MAASAGTPDDSAPGRLAATASPASATAARSTENTHRYAGREWTSEHPLNIRVSIPLLFGRYYISVVAGKERRARARLALDKRQHPLDTPGNVIFLFFIGVIAAAGSVTVGYMLLAHLMGWSGRLVL
jgi:hypothetical protein